MATSAASGGAVASVRAEPELMRAVSLADGEAQRTLALRLVVRVRRAAHAFMRGSVDADDAALHALIEILRSAHTYRGDTSLQAWADRALGHSIVRFARAVRRRNGEPLGGDDPLPDERTPARTLDQMMRRIPPVRREVLLLRHVLGQGLPEIAEITQASIGMVRERLLTARRELRRTLPHPVTVGDASVVEAERWASLRDREAIGETLRADELHELAELERSSPAARAHVTQQRELAAMLEAGPSEPAAPELHLVERALAAVQVTSQPLRTRSHDPDADLESAVDPEGPRWVRSGSIALSVLMGLGAVAALAVYEPRSSARGSLVAGTMVESGPAPTVEALTTAHTGRRDGRLRRGGRALPPDAVLSVEEELSAVDRPGCIAVEPRSEVCLAAGSTVRIASLALRATAIEVVRGRAIATHEGPPGTFALVSADVRAHARGTVFGLERSDDGDAVRVRVLEGLVQVESPYGVSEVRALEMAVVRRSAGTNLRETIPGGQLQREWELRATSLPPSALPAHARPTPALAEAAAAAEEARALPSSSQPVRAAAPAVAATGKEPRVLLTEAWELLKAKRWKDAVRLYEAILREHPESPEAHVVLVRLGDVQLERLDQPAAALASFERYLREGSGPLEVEALHGRMEALAKLRRPADERAAIQDFLRVLPNGLKAEAARARLAKLEGR